MGLTHLDAGVIIGFLDGADAHHHSARAALSASLSRGDRLCMAASALAECLVGPARQGREKVDLVHQVIARLPVFVIDLDAEIATAAAVLRASHRSLKLPDALVIATATVGGADQLITTDRRWPTAQTMGLSASVTEL